MGVNITSTTFFDRLYDFGLLNKVTKETFSGPKSKEHTTALPDSTVQGLYGIGVKSRSALEFMKVTSVEDFYQLPASQIRASLRGMLPNSQIGRVMNIHHGVLVTLGFDPIDAPSGFPNEPVINLHGIGHKTAELLAERQIYSTVDLAKASERRIRQALIGETPAEIMNGLSEEAVVQVIAIRNGLRNSSKE